jgi:hypothetical protein
MFMRVMIVPRWDLVNQIPLRYRGFLGVGGGVGDSGSEPELNKINDLKRKRVTAHKPGAVAPGVASALTRSSSQDVSDELPAGRKKFQL